MARTEDELSSLTLPDGGNGINEFPRWCRQGGLQVVDSSSRMLLLEESGDASSAESLKNALPQWSVSEEVGYSLPDPTPRVRIPGKGSSKGSP